MATLFLGCISLAHVNFLNSWDVSETCDVKDMFYGCGVLEKYPLWYIEKTEIRDEAPEEDSIEEDESEEPSKEENSEESPDEDDSAEEKSPQK